MLAVLSVKAITRSGINGSKSTAFQKVICELPFASVSKRVLVRNYSYENEFDLHENEPVGGTHFHMNGFTQRLVLTQRQKATRKWPILIHLQPNICLSRNWKDIYWVEGGLE